MPNLQIIVNNKVASYVKRGGDIVCGNSGYVVEFVFDQEWATYEKKTARFIWGGEYHDVDFEGTTCPVPIVQGATVLSVGVYAGNLTTSTPALIMCQRSILCGGEPQSAGSAEQYTNEAKVAADRAEAAADAAAEAAVQRFAERSAALQLGGIVQTTGDSETQVMSQKAVTDELESIVEQNCNLFNKDSDDILNGFLSSTFVENAGYRTSHPIKVEEGVTYRWSVKRTDVGGNAVKVAYVGDNGEFLPDEYGYVSVSEAQWYDDTQTSMIFTATKTGYVRVNIGSTKYLTSCMFCRAELYPNEYVPFALFVKPLVRSENLRGSMPTEWLAEIVEATGANPLAGKKATFNGDSICAGAGYDGGYAKIIAEMFGMTVQNIGVGGGTIAAEQYNGEKARHWICRTIANMDADADYAIVEGGVNDASLQVSLGTLSSGYNATLDDTTFYGAFESMLKQLLIRFAGKKVGYIAVHQMSSNYRAINDLETSYYWAAKKCCEKWGVPFCDLNVSVPPFAFFSESGDAELSALRTTYTKDGDGWHPNEEGYRKYYVPKIEAWLKTL